MTDADIERLHQAVNEASRKLCEVCDENPDHSGDCRGHDARWEDYRDVLLPALEVFLEEIQGLEQTHSLYGLTHEFRHQYFDALYGSNH